MVAAGGGAVTTGLIASVTHTCSSPPVEFVFQAISPVMTGEIIRRLTQVDQAMTVGVRHAWGMVFRNAQLMSIPVWTARGGVIWRIGGTLGHGGHGFDGKLSGPGVDSRPLGDLSRA